MSSIPSSPKLFSGFLVIITIVYALGYFISFFYEKYNISMSIRNIFSVLFTRILNRSNFNKFLTIFIFGFISRIFVNYLHNNVYLDFLSSIYIVYYLCMSTFIVLVYEFINYFGFNIISYFRFLIIKEGLKICFYNSFNNKMYMDSINGIKPYGKTELYIKDNSSYRPVKSSPLSNTPITPDNINEMKPTREIKFSCKTNSSLRPVNFNDPTTSQKVSTRDLTFQERNNDIIKFKDKFKVFYTTYRKSIKLSDYELECLSIKMAVEEEKGYDSSDLLPEDIKPLYKKHLRNVFNSKNKP